MMRENVIVQAVLNAIFSSKVWGSVVFIAFGVCVVVYVFSIVTGASPLLLVQQS